MRAIYFTPLIACVISLFSCKKDSVDVCEPGSCTITKPQDTYDYPIKPGTPQWAMFTDGQQMLDACQIPTDTLSKMSTEGLIQTCIDFPLLGDLLLNIGVNVPAALKNKMLTFSGLIELSKRQDAGIKMINRYLMMSSSCINNYSYSEKMIFRPQFSAFEMIISYDSIINKMSLDDKKVLIKEALKKYSCKREQQNNYAYYDFATSLYIPTKIMMQENYAPFIQKVFTDTQLQLFVDKLLWPDIYAPTGYKETDAMFNVIVENANSFIK